jgi:hypothetical protein
MEQISFRLRKAQTNALIAAAYSDRLQFPNGQYALVLRTDVRNI